MSQDSKTSSELNEKAIMKSPKRITANRIEFDNNYFQVNAKKEKEKK